MKPTNHMMLVELALTATIGLAWSVPSMASNWRDRSGWRPTRAQIADIEKRIDLTTLPLDGPLDSFERYYAGLKKRGRRNIAVEYLGLNTMPRPPGGIDVISYKQIPAIGDGGCSVVSFTYDPAAKKFSTPQCNFELPSPPPPQETRSNGEPRL